MSCWSDLANDLLEHLTGLLSLPDQHRFSAVCHNWRLVAKQKRCHPPKPQLPWLVLGEDEKTKKRNFFNLLEQRHYSIDIPELYGQFICGSSHGWFITSDIRMNGRVVNPFTRECIHLPPFPPFDEKNNITTYTPVSIIGSTGEFTCSFTDMQKYLVLKAVLSHDPREKSDNFIVMILFGKYSRVAIWRPNDTDWRVIDSLSGSIVDIFYFQGQLYAVDSCFAYVFVIDVGDPELRVRQINTHGPDPYSAYVMVFKGNLLVVSRFQDFETMQTKKFLVRTIEMNWSEFEVETPRVERWYEWEKKIAEHALFVGKNATIFVNPSEFPTQSCVTNGIYFSDVPYSCFWDQDYGHDFGVYDMDRNTLGQFISTSGIDRVHACCPLRCNAGCVLPRDAALTWFTPSPSP